MSTLGDEFSKKLNEQQFEATPQNWRDMEKLLDKKKPKAFWLFNSTLIAVLTILIIGGASAAWLLSGRNEAAKNAVATEHHTNSGTINNSTQDAITEDANEINAVSATAQIKPAPETTATQANTQNGNSTQTHTTQTSTLQTATTQKPASQKTTQAQNANSPLTAASQAPQPASPAAANTLPSEPLSGKWMPQGVSWMNRIMLTNLDNNSREEANALKNIKAETKKLPLHLRPKLYAGIYAGIMYTDKSLTRIPNVNSGVGLDANADYADEYFARRNKEEKGSYAWNTGIDLGFTWRNWIFGTGVNYHQMSDASDYNNQFRKWAVHDTAYWNVIDNSYYDVNTLDFWVSTDNNYWSTGDTTITYWCDSTGTYETTTVPTNVYVVNDVDSEHVYISDSVFVQQIDSTEVLSSDSTLQMVSDMQYKRRTIRNTLSYVEIPLLIGYEFPLGRVSLTAKTGVGLGVLTTQDITYIKMDGSGVERYGVSTTSRLVWNYLFRFGANYYFTDHMALNVESMFRANLSNAFNSEFGMKQKYWGVGLNVGVNYRF